MGGEADHRLTARPNKEQMQQYGIDHYKGKQFKYVKYICSKTEKRKLMKELKTYQYPKEQDLAWRKKDLATGKWLESGKPPYITDFEGQRWKNV